MEHLKEDLLIIPITGLSFDGIELMKENHKKNHYYFYIDEVGLVEQIKPNPPITITLKKGVNY